MSFDDDDWDEILWDFSDLGWRWFTVLAFVVLVFIVGFFVGSHSSSIRFGEEAARESAAARECREQLHGEQTAHQAYRDQVREQFESIFRECGKL